MATSATPGRSFSVVMSPTQHAASSIARRLRGDERTPPFKYRDLGSVATIGRFRAIVSVRRVRLSGFPAWLVWLLVHLAFLNGFSNRFSSLMHWARSMIGRARPERAFSVGRTGGDLSTPGVARAVVQPSAFPVVDAAHEPRADPSGSDAGATSGDQPR